MPLLMEVRKISYCSYFCVTLLIYPRSPQKMFGVNVYIISIEEIQNQASLIIHSFPGFLFKNGNNSKVKKNKRKRRKREQVWKRNWSRNWFRSWIKNKKEKGFFLFCFVIQIFIIHFIAILKWLARSIWGKGELVSTVSKAKNLCWKGYFKYSYWIQVHHSPKYFTE